MRDLADGAISQGTARTKTEEPDSAHLHRNAVSCLLVCSLSRSLAVFASPITRHRLVAGETYTSGTYPFTVGGLFRPVEPGRSAKIWPESCPKNESDIQSMSCLTSWRCELDSLIVMCSMRMQCPRRVPQSRPSRRTIHPSLHCQSRLSVAACPRIQAT